MHLTILPKRFFLQHNDTYCKVPKFSDPTKLCCNLPKILTKGPNLKVLV